MTSVDGLVTGLDTKSIVSQLMKIERIPQTLLDQRRGKEEGVAKALSSVRAPIVALRDLARSMRGPATWQALTATASSDAVSVAARTGRATGALQVRVDQVASAAAIYSEAVPSMDRVIAAGGSVFSYSNATAVGFDSIKGNGIPIGDLPITVITPTAPATVTSGAIPTFPVELTSADNSLTFTIDGMSQTVTLKPGPYGNPAELRSALEDAIASHGQARGTARVGQEPDGRLLLSSTREGSAAQLAITGGTAMVKLGFDGTETATGVDGAVRAGVDGPVTAVTTTAKGATATLAGPGGSTVSVTMGGPLRTGTVNASQRSFGAGTVREVVEAINTADGLGYTAAAVNVGSGIRLQLTAKQTGQASSVDIDQSMFTGFGSQAPFSVLSAGRDAELTVIGDGGQAGYRVTSATNTFSDLLPGVDLTVRRTDANPITVSASADREKAADQVASLIEAVNTALKAIASETAFDPKTGRGSQLTGNAAVRRAAQELTRSLLDPLDGALGSAGQVGISLNRDGTLAFDRSAFLAKVAEDPEAVSGGFSQLAGGNGPGILDRLAARAHDAISFGSGYLSSAQDAVADRIQSYTRQIDAYETRMVLREAQIRRTYANLETAMSGLNSQSNWLAGQLKGLYGTNNNS